LAFFTIFADMKVHTPKELFTRTNYIIMFAGIALIFLGMILMATDSKTQGDQFGPQAMVVAPAVILLGFAIEFFAIMYREKPAEKATDVASHPDTIQ
jgi:uncharacterized membrane protein